MAPLLDVHAQIKIRECAQRRETCDSTVFAPQVRFNYVPVWHSIRGLLAWIKNALKPHYRIFFKGPKSTAVFSRQYCLLYCRTGKPLCCCGCGCHVVAASEDSRWTYAWEQGWVAIGTPFPQNQLLFWLNFVWAIKGHEIPGVSWPDGA